MTLPPHMLIPAADLAAYVFDPTGQDWGNLLAPFHPPLPRDGQVILASFFCDVFVEDREGAVWWVNGLEERVDRIAINREKAIARIDAEHFVMLKTKILEQLIVSDRLLPVGLLYGLKTPRAEGGQYSLDNIGTAAIAESFAYLGARFRARNTPPPPQPTTAEAKPKNTLWGKKS